MAYKEFSVEGIGNVKIYKRKSSRYLRITVPSNGNVRVTTPVWVPYRAGLAFVRSKHDWILSQNRTKTHILLEDNQPIGKSQHLVFRKGAVATDIKTRIMGNEVIVSHPVRMNINDNLVQSAARVAAIRALRGQAQILLKLRLDNLSQKYNLAYNGFSVKSMRSRWGSCDQHKNIVLNIYLIQLPWELIDYVIIHELTHTKIMRHGPDFWMEMERLLPEVKSRRKDIKNYRPTLELS